MVNVLDTSMQELVNLLVYHNVRYHNITYHRQVKPKNNSLTDHLLFCNHSLSHDDFSILTPEKKKISLELKESL